MNGKQHFNRHKVSSWSNRNILEQHSEFTEYHWFIHFKIVNLMHVNFTSVKKNLIKGMCSEALVGKKPIRKCKRGKRCGFSPWARKVPWLRTWHPTPVFLPGGLQSIGLVAKSQTWLKRFIMHSQSLSHGWLFAVPRTVAHQVLLPMEFFRQEYQNGVPFPTPGDLPDPGNELASLVSLELGSRFFTTNATCVAQIKEYRMAFIQTKNKNREVYA